MWVLLEKEGVDKSRCDWRRRGSGVIGVGGT